MFGQLGWGEVLVIIVVGLFVFGPERLPGIARDAGKMLRQLRSMANGVRDDIRSELGPEVADLDLASLNPRTFVTRHLLADDDETELAAQLDRPGRGGGDAVNGAPRMPGAPAQRQHVSGQVARPVAPHQPQPVSTPWDDDAT